MLPPLVVVPSDAEAAMSIVGVGVVAAARKGACTKLTLCIKVLGGKVAEPA